MKKSIIILILFGICLTLLAGCGNNANTTTADNELLQQAHDILEQLPSDKRIDDFITASEILKDLPKSQKTFVKALQDAQNICDKYDLELERAAHCLSMYEYDKLTDELITDYTTNNVCYDIWDMTKTLIYPILFEQYGRQAAHLSGIDIALARQTLRNMGATLESTKVDDLMLTTEEWKMPNTAAGSPEIKFHDNGLVQEISFPLIISTDPLNDQELMYYFNLPLDQLTDFSAQRFSELLSSFDGFTYGTDILDILFTQQQQAVIEHFISNLTPEYIWEHSLLNYGQETNNIPYGAILSIPYANTDITLSFGLNSIKIRLIDTNSVNELSQKYYTVLAAFSDMDHIKETYADHIIGNTDMNDDINEIQIDLGAMEADILAALQSSKAPVTVKFMSDVDLNSFSTYEKYEDTPTEYQTEFMIIPQTELHDFALISISPNDAGKYVIKESLYSSSKLMPQMPLAVTTSFTGLFAHMGITFTDTSGQVYYYTIEISNIDGELTLSEFQPVMQ